MRKKTTLKYLWMLGVFLSGVSNDALFAQTYGAGFHIVNIPSDAIEVDIFAKGADGGDSESAVPSIAISTSNGGAGATASGTFPVSGGNSLYVIVGSAGKYGVGDGGGGGGGSAVAMNGGIPLIVAGGGGGANYSSNGGGGSAGSGSGNGGDDGNATNSGGGGGGINSAGQTFGISRLYEVVVSARESSSDGGGGGGGQASASSLSGGGSPQSSFSGGGGSGFGGGGGGGDNGGGGGGGFSGGNGGSNGGGRGGGSFIYPGGSGSTAPGGTGSGQSGSVTISFQFTADACPNDPNKTRPGFCGCGVADGDFDDDGTPDCVDGCPLDPFKTSEGACGCGNKETDRDSDGTPDCNDGCPLDPNKIKPGCLGCGTPDIDKDGDGKVDCEDSCPDNFNPSQSIAGDCDCEAPSIIGVEVLNTSTCDEDRDVFTADVRITFIDPPTNGAIAISGDINLGESAERIDFVEGSKETVFLIQGKEFKADGGPISILVNYIGNEGCFFNLANAGMAPEACIDLNNMPVIIRTRETANYCDLIMKDSGIYKLVTWINGDSANTVKVQIVQTDSDKSITILQNLQNANGRLEGFIQILNIDPTISLGIINPRTTPKMKGRWSPPLRIDYQPSAGDECIGIPPIKFIECNDNGTSDPDDDYLIFDLTVIGEKDKTYNLDNGITPSKGVFNTLSSFRAPAGSANGDPFSFLVTTTDETSCTIMVALENPGFCSDVCRITDISLTNFKRCHDRGTIRPEDDFFMADITISFKNPPSNGFLNLDAIATYTSEGNFQEFFEDATSVASLSSETSHIFQNVTIPEGADDYNIFASFSADNCEFNLSEYYIPNVPCVTLKDCPPVNMLSVELDENARNTVFFDWEYIPNALLQEVEIRVDDLPWQTIANDSSEARISALLPNTNYEYRVRYYCQENAWSEYIFGTFTTGESPLENNFNTPNTGGETRTKAVTKNQFLGTSNFNNKGLGDQGQLKLFPNPVTDELMLYVDFEKEMLSENIDLVVYDFLGKKILQQQLKIDDKVSKLVVSQLNSGIYHLKIQAGSQLLSAKFIKK